MVLGEQHRIWDTRSQSPYYNVSDADDRKVMDLSNYNSSSPMMVCCGSSSPPSHNQQDTVLRLGPVLHQQQHQHQGPSPPPPGSSSPQPGRTVITSVPYKPYYSPHHHHHLQVSGSPLVIPASAVRPQLSSLGCSPSGGPPRKKKLPQPIPEECKDDAYWERRKRNNESAKRSRELRRNKEMLTADRVNLLESENLQLRTEVAMLRNEVEKLRQLLIPKSSLVASS